jgi:hypothetical protein
MNYYFERRDDNSFSNCSRVYDVIDAKTGDFIVAYVIGYDSQAVNFFITPLGDSVLQDKYYTSIHFISKHKIASSLYEFFNVLKFMDAKDFVDESYNKKMFVEPTKENFVFYVSEIYIKDNNVKTDCPFSTEMLRQNILIPKFMENFDIDEYQPYSYSKLVRAVCYDHCDVGLYCEIDFDKLKKYLE